jgi:hypothetical protein
LRFNDNVGVAISPCSLISMSGLSISLLSMEVLPQVVLRLLVVIAQ